MDTPVSLFWFRRDLRLSDNVALAQALQNGPVLPIFIFDRAILDKLATGPEPRVQFLHEHLAAIKTQLEAWGSTLRVYYSTPAQVFEHIKSEYPALEHVFANQDYEPYARQRDPAVAQQLTQQGVALHLYKDHVLFHEREILNQAGNPFTVYTPYSKVWRARFTPDMLAEHAIEPRRAHFWQTETRWLMPTLAAMGFAPGTIAFPDNGFKADILARYAAERDTPAVEGTSRLSVHLRFGTISIRQAYTAGFAHSDKWVSELIWREFYQQILANFPEVVNTAFKPEYDQIPWRTGPAAEADFAHWCAGTTGYALVDAGMRQLLKEGWIHNRVRMVVASFLSKHLLLDWRWGQAHFAAKLIDFDLASNNGGWQWAAGTGADAAPYFRVFNPYLQAEKHDPTNTYIRRFVPEYETLAYQMHPIVDHAFARQRALEAYSVGLKGKPLREL